MDSSTPSASTIIYIDLRKLVLSVYDNDTGTIYFNLSVQNPPNPNKKKKPEEKEYIATYLIAKWTVSVDCGQVTTKLTDTISTKEFAEQFVNFYTSEPYIELKDECKTASSEDAKSFEILKDDCEWKWYLWKNEQGKYGIMSYWKQCYSDRKENTEWTLFTATAAKWGVTPTVGISPIAPLQSKMDWSIKFEKKRKNGLSDEELKLEEIMKGRLPNVNQTTTITDNTVLSKRASMDSENNAPDPQKKVKA